MEDGNFDQVAEFADGGATECRAEASESMLRGSRGSGEFSSRMGRSSCFIGFIIEGFKGALHFASKIIEYTLLSLLTTTIWTKLHECVALQRSRSFCFTVCLNMSSNRHVQLWIINSLVTETEIARWTWTAIIKLCSMLLISPLASASNWTV